MRLGVDIGGTFTDVVLISESGEIWTSKTLTTPHDPLDAVISGIHTACKRGSSEPGAITSLVHGTTLVPNALIERKGARTAVVTTAGFRDIPEIGREWRYDIYDIFLEAPPLLVDRPDRFEVSERTQPLGEISCPLNVDQLRDVVRGLSQEIKSVAICFLHSYANRTNELKAAQVIEDMRPDLFVTASSAISPEMREFERFSTAIANAYVQPLVKPYLEQLSNGIRRSGIRSEPFIMLSNGGLTSLKLAASEPIRMVESGPAAGVIAAAYYSRLLDERDVLAFDMGGTTAKAAFVSSGQPLMARGFEVARAYRFKPGSGIPLNINSIEMIEIGAGGGSIARIDSLGRLKVGPDSAGADPGPVCYGLGGQEPTVTDGDLQLGYLQADRFLDGDMHLDAKKNTKAIKDKLADGLGYSETEAAWGIHQVINDSMANAVRVHAAEHGRDVSKCSMLPFGGAAGIHACHVAEQLGIRKVISPMRASVLSAFGMLDAPVAFDFVRTSRMMLSGQAAGQITAIYQEMMEEGYSVLAAAGIAKSKAKFSPSIDLQYVGQGHFVTVDVPLAWIKRNEVGKILGKFEKKYAELHSRLPQAIAVVAVNWRLRAAGPEPKVHLPTFDEAHGSEQAHYRTAPAYFREFGLLETNRYRRTELGAGNVLTTPSVVEDIDTSFLIPPNWNARVDQYRNIIATRDK